MEKMRVHSPSEYVPKSIIEIEKKINEMVDEMNEMEEKIAILEGRKKPSKGEEEER